MRKRKKLWLGLYVFVIVIVGFFTASLEPFNSDTYANIFAALNIRQGGAFFMPVHTNIIKAPVYLLGYALFGYSPATVVFIDAVSSIGFILLTSFCAYWWLKNRGDVLDVSAPFVYMALLSPFFLYLTVNPGLRNLDVGVSFVWMLLVLDTKISPKWRLLAIPLGALLLVNDPWFVVAFALPALVTPWLVLILNHLTARPADQSITKSWFGSYRQGIGVAPLAILSVAGGYLLRFGMERTGLVRFVGVESDYQFLLAHKLENLLHITQAVLKFFNADTAWVVPPEHMGNVVLVFLGMAGVFMGVLSKDERTRILSCFVVTASAISGAVYAFTNASAVVLSERYLIFLPLAVIIGIANFLAALRGKFSILRVAVLAILALSFAANFSSILNWLPHIRNPGRLELQAAIINGAQKDNLKYGFGAYFDSLNSTFVSAGDVTIRQVTCNNGRLQIMRWWSQSKWYAPEAAAGPTFVVLSASPGEDLSEHCPAQKLAQQFGPYRAQPVMLHEKLVATYYIWDYNIANRIDK